ncbi:uncharacterized protein BT62DRAFT_926163 [Guyanagaster necrorhizus]|uniref:F-box domain-containing protein n=1 Tax=Guyanagaster necrorhizus TaxID=856835 RepID=A0A9P7W3H5_9AGAR|nr:uncharacterized protein BT62DRAFT_926163 [Guyanagaster necrorhizus MCA 3950]KAG7451963.1 hypothetical protein BT62DRAFT_926163 [Guyanagaster necrorhizus MCA 3950]
MSSLLSLPRETIDLIAFYIACPTHGGLPSSLLPFVLTCRKIGLYLHESNAVFREIFIFKYSYGAVGRRAFDLTSRDLKHQLYWYRKTLRFILERRGLDGERELRNTYDVDVSDVLWVVYFMCLDDDGYNLRQLTAVGAYEWIHDFVTLRLYDGASENGGWPLDNCVNALALWIFWRLSTKARLFSETDETSDRIIKLILPFVTVPFRYASAFAPPNHFDLPLQSKAYNFAHLSSRIPFHTRSAHFLSVPTAHGPYPVYLSPSRVWSQVHFSRRICLTCPLVTTAAKLLFFTRRELYPYGMNYSLPRNRSEAISRGLGGQIGPTQEDIHEMNLHRLGGPDGKYGGTKLPTVAPDFSDEVPDISRAYDPEWYRLRLCTNAWADDLGDDDEIWRRAKLGKGMRVKTADHEVRELRFRQAEMHVLGSLTGLWAGRMAIPGEHQLLQLLIANQNNTRRNSTQNDNPVPFPQGFSEDYLGLISAPLYMRLREHVSYAGGDIVPTGASGVSPSRYEDAEEEEEETDEDDVDSLCDVEMASESGSQDDNMPIDEDESRPEIDRQHLLYEFDQGMRNAYFPEDVAFRDTVDGHGIRVTARGQEYVYENWNGSDSRTKTKGRFHDRETCVGCAMREKQERKRRDAGADAAVNDEDAPLDNVPPPPCTGVQDVIITGRTDERHGQAWNHYTYYGRVRRWDGMIGILRVARDRRLGNLFFYGYIVGGKNFVGNWRITHEDPGMPAWEGPFTLSKVTESDAYA